MSESAAAPVASPAKWRRVSVDFDLPSCRSHIVDIPFCDVAIIAERAILPIVARHVDQQNWVREIPVFRRRVVFFKLSQVKSHWEVSAMQPEMECADELCELADWLRAVAGDKTEDAGFRALMARVADVVDGLADDEPQDVVPDIPPLNVIAHPHRRPVAANDNLRLLPRRRKG
jgi:hypothetical protein